ncbi:hypothetical protein CMUS01_04233 [Colletotrichum musicola]|uniref:Uncharacterized protein n=1 Tax=Colletotrichum musicola TaxID=2175873 RepID=A0A8H6NNI1_9PEZI|nr:hypothetical protein CMUS01_04233 [Colletotrichum musicola]
MNCGVEAANTRVKVERLLLDETLQRTLSNSGRKVIEALGIQTVGRCIDGESDRKSKRRGTGCERNANDAGLVPVDNDARILGRHGVGDDGAGRSESAMKSTYGDDQPKSHVVADRFTASPDGSGRDRWLVP